MASLASGTIMKSRWSKADQAEYARGIIGEGCFRGYCGAESDGGGVQRPNPVESATTIVQCVGCKRGH